MAWLLAYFVAVAAFLHWRRVPLFHPAMASTLVWLGVIFVGALGLVEYFGTLRWQTIAFVAVCHSLLLLGFALVPREPGRTRVELRPGVTSALLGSIAALFVALQWAASLQDGNVPIIDTVANVAQNRVSHWAGVGDSALQQAARALGYPAVAYVVLLPLYWRDRRFLHVALGVATFAALADLSLADGGRVLIAFTLFMAAVVYFVSRKGAILRLALASVGAVLFVWVMGSSFYLARNPAFDNAPGLFVRYNCMGGRLSDGLARAEVEAQAFALTTCYVTAPIRVLDEYLGNREIDFTLGAYNAGIITRDTFDETRERLGAFFRARRLAENPWATSMRDFYIDFGYFGALLFLPLGMILAAFSRRSVLTSEAAVVSYAAATLSVVMLPFISPLILRAVIYPVMAAWLVAGVATLIPQRRVRKHVPARPRFI